MRARKAGVRPWRPGTQWGEPPKGCKQKSKIIYACDLEKSLSTQKRKLRAHLPGRGQVARPPSLTYGWESMRAAQKEAWEEMGLCRVRRLPQWLQPIDDSLPLCPSL